MSSSLPIGDEKALSGVRCKVTQTGDRFQTAYYTGKAQKFKSVTEVAKFLNLTNGSNNSSTQKGKVIVKKSQPRNLRELENERKKLRRELDKLMKSHDKASKAHDDFHNDKSNDEHQIDDDLLPFNPTKNKALWAVLSKPEIDSFPGIPASCTQDVLMIWNFLSTFHRIISLHPFDLEDFVAALIYKPADISEASDPTPPLLLAETHLALLKLLLSDGSSDSWWWSTLETPETEGKEETTRGEADNIAPTIKLDFKALLDFDEDINITRKWLQALEDVRTRRANAGASIKSSIKSASFLATNPMVKTYLRKAMRGWKGNDAAFAKQSVMWLIGRLREARPDLWGRQIDASILAEVKAKVATEAEASMEQLDEDEELDNGEEIHYGDSDGEDSDSDEEEELETEDNFQGKQGSFRGKTIENMQPSVMVEKKEDTSALVVTPIPEKPPPSLVDLFLPPYKPQHNSYIVSPFTWSFVVGASVGRILHRYKRLRNEVDDSLREFGELKPLTIAERRRREKIAPQRIFSECISTTENDQECPVENAVEHLTNGKNYLSLSPLQRLSILRVLVESAYDTIRVHQCVQDNIQSRISAVKQLENEERRAKKEAKEAASLVESAARERLAEEAKDEFISKKRREIIRKNKFTGEFTTDHLENLDDEEIAEFDDETKAEYDALPGPKQFNKNEVKKTVAKINEENAFGTSALEVLTLEEIQSREANTLIEMEDELANYGDSANSFNRDTSAKINALKREIENFKEWQETLPASRAEATEVLKEAIDDGTVKPLRNAIRTAKQALLSGEDEETGGMWAYDLLRDAALELKQSEKRKRVIEAQKDLVAKRNKCFVRTDSIGKDRAHNRYWHFDNDSHDRIWFDAEFKLYSEQDESVDATPTIDESVITLGPGDKEEDLAKTDEKNYIPFSRKEYHPSGRISSLARHRNGCLSSNESLRALIKNLESKGLLEGSLKLSVKEILEGSGALDISSTDDGENESPVQKSGDEEVFQEAKADASGQEIEMISSLESAIDERCRLRIVHDDISAPDAGIYVMGTVVGWRMKKTIIQIQSQNENSESEYEDETMIDRVPQVIEKDLPVWSLSLDKGGMKEIHASELINGLIRAKKWKHQYPGYVEYDSPLFAYRNKLGRFCGRAADAPYASSPHFFSKLMIKREQEFYNSLKSRSYDNTWGGRDGLRNTWIASMKEDFDNLYTLRDGLLTLEQAFHDLCGGDTSMESKSDDEERKSAKELLEDDVLRCDIELESLGLAIGGLWHCKESREVFREIISSECHYTLAGL